MIHHVLVNWTERITLPWPGLSNDSCSRPALTRDAPEEQGVNIRALQGQAAPGKTKD